VPADQSDSDGARGEEGRRRFNALFEPLSLTADQFVLLSLLKEIGPCSQRQLADLSFADGNTVGAMLRLLERRKLVRRSPHREDGRAKSVSLTAAGERLRSTCETASVPLLAALESCFQSTDSASATLARVIDSMRRGEPKT
jgi:DNA-binding MarR family transcriptional regulator